MLVYRRTFGILTLAFLMLSTAVAAPAQGVERVATLGVYDVNPRDTADLIRLVDLSADQPVLSATDSRSGTGGGDGPPWSFLVICKKNCPLQKGQTYKARITGVQEHCTFETLDVPCNVIEFFVNGSRMRAPGYQEPCVRKNDLTGKRHWEVYPGMVLCMDGPDPMQWAVAAPPCERQSPFRAQTFPVVVTVRTAPGYQWTITDAPSYFTRKLLLELNTRNKNGLVFEEANGVSPQFTFVMTLLQKSGEGTLRNQAWVETYGLGKPGVLFSVNSGEAPFSNMNDAFTSVENKLLVFFENGWRHNPPCRESDGSVFMGSG